MSGNRAARQQHEAAEQRKAKAWALYHDPEKHWSAKEIGEELGVHEYTAYRYISEMTARCRDQRSEEMARVLARRLASSARILDKVERRLLEALDDGGNLDGDEAAEAKRILLDIKGLHDVYAKRLDQESKWLGLDSPIKVQDVTFSPEDLATIAKSATPEERPRIRGGDVALAQAVLDRARAAEG